MQWDFPVANGELEVRLYLAEIYFTSPGKRVFDVLIEETTMLENFDIYSEAGGANTGVMRSFVVGVEDGTLSIRLDRLVENPKISAIEILSVP